MHVIVGLGCPAQVPRIEASCLATNEVRRRLLRIGLAVGPEAYHSRCCDAAVAAGGRSSVGGLSATSIGITLVALLHKLRNVREADEPTRIWLLVESALRPLHPRPERYNLDGSVELAFAPTCTAQKTRVRQLGSAESVELLFDRSIFVRVEILRQELTDDELEKSCPVILAQAVPSVQGLVTLSHIIVSHLQGNLAGHCSADPFQSARHLLALAKSMSPGPIMRPSTNLSRQ